MSALLHAIMLAASSTPSDEACRAMASAVAAGSVVDADNTRVVPCGDESRSGKLRYDSRAGVVRARRALVAGEALGRSWLPARPHLLPGDMVSITAKIGNAFVSREFVALQAAYPGKRFFVTSAEGAIFAAPKINTAER